MITTNILKNFVYANHIRLIFIIFCVLSKPEKVGAVRPYVLMNSWAQELNNLPKVCSFREAKSRTFFHLQLSPALLCLIMENKTIFSELLGSRLTRVPLELK